MKKKKIAEKVVKTLISKGITISSAESMTGGYFAKTLTDVPGASKVFDRSIVTYSKQSKCDELGLDINDINNYGVVSDYVAKAMSKGLFLASKSDVCIAITGVAGPGPDEGVEEGTFYIGLTVKGEITAYKYELGPIGRKKIRKQAVIEMFKLIDNNGILW